MLCLRTNEDAYGKRSALRATELHFVQMKKAIPSPSGDRIAFLAAKSRSSAEPAHAIVLPHRWETRSNGDLVIRVSVVAQSLCF